LKHSDMHAIEEQLTAELVKLPDLLNESLVIDLHDISTAEADLDFPALFTTIYRLNLIPIGICDGNEVQKAAARAAGIPVLAGGASTKRRPTNDHAKEQAVEKRPRDEPMTPSAPQPTTELSPAQIIDTPVRTGQRVFSNGDLTLLAGVNPGAEVLAAGSIHVYGPLRGRALAGVGGDQKARIFTKCMDAQLVSIAGCFRVLESELSKDVQGKPAQIYLDGERVVIKPL